MAVQPTATWRLWVNGDDTNGAGFDSGISGAGTDYSQQALAQLSLTDLATSAANSTTLTSATGGFTAAMVGNAIKISSGTNFTVGWYFITGYTNTNTVTLDRTPTPAAAGSAGAGKVGGAAATSNIWDNRVTPASPMVAGNTLYVRGNNTTQVPTNTTLASAVTSSTQTSITVTSATGFPIAPFYIRVSLGSTLECMQVTAVSGITWTVVRGVGASTPKTSIPAGEKVMIVDFISASGSYTTPPAGNSTNGYISIVADTGYVPVMSGAGLFIHSGVFLILKGFYFTCNFTQSISGNAMCNAAPGKFLDSVFDSSNINGQCAKLSGGVIQNCEMWSGTTAYSSANTIQSGFIASTYNTQIIGCHIHHLGGQGIEDISVIGTVDNTLIHHIGNDGIHASTGASSSYIRAVKNCTIDTIGGTGINLIQTDILSLMTFACYNNIISNATTGLSVSTTGTPTSEMVLMFDYNHLYNCTTNYSDTVLAGANDTTTVDPQYTNASIFDYTIGTNLKALAAPDWNLLDQTQATGVQTWRSDYRDPGALQRQEPAAGGGGGVFFSGI